MKNKNTLKPNDTLQNGRYKIVKVLGQGGFGITYLAKHNILEGDMAVKELFLSAAQSYCTRTSDNTVLPQFDTSQFEEFRKKFNDEANTLLKLKGIKGVVQVNDAFEENGTSYFVMEFVKGQSLSQLVKQKGKLSVQQAIDYTLQILTTMEQVHKQGILHRDIKPDNILLDQNNQPVIVDFGIAREYEQDVTKTQTAFRTPGYYAPEQASLKAKRGAYTDIYSIGATLYYMLTGTKPETIEDRNLEGLTPPKDYNPDIPDNLNNIIIKALNIRPSERYQYCHEMIEAIKQRDEYSSTSESTIMDTNDATIVESGILDTDATLVDSELERKSNSKKESVNPPPKNVKKKKKKLIGCLWIFIAVAVLAIGGLVFFGIEAEKHDWEKAKTENTIASYEEYITEHSQGEHVPEAEQAIELLKNYPEMVFINGGTFQMGSNDGSDDEKPVHSVTVNSFYIGKYEVTFEEYDAFCDATGRNKPDDEGWGRGNRPVINVSWEDADAYCKWLSTETGKTYRLPTEAEWEYAAGGGSTHREYAGTNSESSLGDYAWYGDNSGGKTHPVGTKNSNSYGLYDMSGNVWEWCNDWYDGNYYSNSPRHNPQGPSSGSGRVHRGGGWFNGASHCRVAVRYDRNPTDSSSGIGFRVAARF